MNIIAICVAAFVPMLVGFVYYNPKVMGTQWMKASGLTYDHLKQGNMLKIFGIVAVFSFLLSTVFTFAVVHQAHLESIVANELADKTSAAGLEAKAVIDNVMAKYGHNFRTFKHGAFHGILYALFFAMPVLGINALFERRTLKYIFIHVLYWAITFAIMGGIISVWE